MTLVLINYEYRMLMGRRRWPIHFQPDGKNDKMPMVCYTSFENSFISTVAWRSAKKQKYNSCYRFKRKANSFFLLTMQPRTEKEISTSSLSSVLFLYLSNFHNNETGRTYYVNHIARTTQWERPTRYIQILRLALIWYYGRFPHN